MYHLKKFSKLYKCFMGLLAAFFIVSATLPAWAKTIAELQAEIRESQNELDALSGDISDLQNEREAVEEEIADLDAELINVYTQIGILEDEIEAKEEDIAVKEGEVAVAKEDLEKAIEEEKRQYEAMKTRIKYMYEAGNPSYMELILTSSSIGDMLNKAEYVEDLYAYDRRMLKQFQKIREEVAALKEKLEAEQKVLEEEKEGLEADKADLTDQQTYLNGILDQKKAQSANYAAEISAAKSKAAEYEKQIAADNKAIAKIKEEERARLAALNAANNAAVTTDNSKKPAAGRTTEAAQGIVAQSGGSASGKQIANYACKFVGNPYVAGGTSLTEGADCSGFIYRVYADFGYGVPRTSYSLRNAGTGVSYDQAQPGDVICYEGHVAMYIGGGMIVHASSAATGIKISNANYKPMVAVRRIVN